MKKAIKHIADRPIFRYFNFLVTGIYGFLKLPYFSYSQHGEDLVLESFFPPGYVGKYIDVGAFHPVWISNTYKLHRKGWVGVVIDLELEKLKFFEMLRGSRIKSICAAVVEGDGEGIAVFNKFRNNLGWSMVDTLSSRHAIRASRKLSSKASVKEVRTLGINKLLQQESPVDLLDLDIEGMDENVVLSIDFTSCSIGVLIFESNYVFGGDFSVRHKLESSGFFHLATMGPSVIYASNEYFKKIKA